MGAPEYTRSEILTRLLSDRIVADSEAYFGIGPCWVGVSGDRPRTCVDGKSVTAARFILSITDGLVLSDDTQFACHHCDVEACIRPDHLYVGDALSNNRDTATRRRNSLLNRRLTFDQAEDIRNRVSAGQSQRSLVSQFGISRTAIRQIVKGKTYRNAA